MIPSTGDTIAAVASALGPGLRGVVRVSGPGAVACVEPAFRDCEKHPLPRSGPPAVRHGWLQLTEIPTPLPCEALLWPTQRSYTRQPVVELHTLASPPLLEAVVATLCLHGARPAEPGEFTLRAFLAGRIDLMQAEAVLGVIDAEDPHALAAALEQLAGGAPEPLADLRAEIVQLLGQIEAALDFDEEHEIDALSGANIPGRLQQVFEALSDLQARIEGRNQLRSETTVVLTGPPNAGKSTLFNALVGRSAALTSDLPGTTRDYVTADVLFDNIPVRLIDTAGLGGETGRPAGLAPAMEAASRQALSQAAVIVQCIDSCDVRPPAVKSDSADVRPTDLFERLIVVTKVDLSRGGGYPADWLATSGRTGQGIAELKRAIARAARNALRRPSGGGLFLPSTVLRCRDGLRRAAESLAMASQMVRQGVGEELIAEELRTALQQVDRLLGFDRPEDLLQSIFSRFCIGK